MRRREAASGVRLGLVCQRFRITLGQMAAFRHALNKDYLRVDPQTMDPNTQAVFKLPLGVLAQDYNIAVVGASDPIDSVTRKQEFLAFYELAVKTMPDVFQDPVKAFFWRRTACEVMGFGQQAQQLIGSEQDAQQARQQMQAMQQAQMEQMQAQTALHKSRAGGAGGGQPSPNGAP